MLEKLHILTSLFVGLVFTLFGLYFKLPPQEMAAKLLGTLIFFYFVGLFLRSFLMKLLIKPEEPPAEGEARAEGEAGENAEGEGAASETAGEM